MSTSEGSSRDSVPDPPKPMTALFNSKRVVKNFSRTNPFDTALSPLNPDRISKHVTFLTTSIHHAIPRTHIETSQFLTNNPQESSTNHPPKFPEPNHNPDDSEDSLEENPPISPSTPATQPRETYSSKAQSTGTVSPKPTELPKTKPSPLNTTNESSHSESDTLQTFFNALEKSFPQYDFDTLQRAIDVIALEQGKTATNGAPSCISLYALLAQIWHSSLTMRDAWMKFQNVGFAVSFGNFSILMRQAEVLKVGDELGMNGLLLTESFCEMAEREIQMLKEKGCEEKVSCQLTEIFCTVLPHVCFGACGWSKALEIFNAHLGMQLGLRRFKKYIIPVVAERLRAHDERHTARIRRVLKKEVVRTGTEITPGTFCEVFNGMTGFGVEEVVLRDVQNYLLGAWRG
ncbi:uncharacterized protein Bfra_005858 [Botrytis fragariae]|uniref:Uncharacterized protein n=1 Tax=Botrytis fragariae TaxID=1964551 RepID=A0A8H6ARW5_9HELO|nr:uncharacterized protein Bfra_005858 [Botrytis fragariae]KAF5872497.1 hypothetical protein Bfra_005858 [Botrytis fragariae]